ncbi:hypothetical protein [Nocardioides taihuensis]|uniref:IPT/TIG domain-containing protein n=1 Tax=Nocardioides taihuensis TaxID=1835606 RepID=A0ABW0BRH0_9ACTN
MTTLILTVLGLVAAALGAFFAYRALFPAARALDVTVLPSRSLLDTGTSANRFELRVDGETIEPDPHMVTVVVTAKGRHDIASSNFEAGRPLHLEIGSPVVKVLGVTATPQRGTTPPVTANGEGIDLGPGLISRGQAIHIQLLTGPPSTEREPNARHDLVDVRVDVTSGESARFRQPVGVRPVAIAAISGLMAGGLLAAGAFYDLADRLPGLSFDPSVAINPKLPSVGAKVRVIGANFEAGALISVDITSEVTEEDFSDVCSTQVGSEGAFVIDCTLPSDLPAGPAEMVIASTEHSGTSYEYVDFAVEAP